LCIILLFSYAHPLIHILECNVLVIACENVHINLLTVYSNL